jgi:hypothetical protein
VSLSISRHYCIFQSLVPCTNIQRVGDLKWVCETGIVFSNNVVRLRIITLPPHTTTSGDFSWRAHSTFEYYHLCLNTVTVIIHFDADSVHDGSLLLAKYSQLQLSNTTMKSHARPALRCYIMGAISFITNK